MSCSVNESLHQFGNRIRLLETHDVSSTQIIRSVTSSDSSSQFHGQWVSGLTQTTILGVPDTELITPLTRANLISVDTESVGNAADQRKLCTAFDADSGGPLVEIPTLVATLARKGVSMIIIEDKEVFEPGKKVNSLAASSASQGQADPQEFANVMAAFKRAKDRHGLEHMCVTARIESFTCRKVISSDPAAEGASVQEALREALKRASIYRNAGADAIMIHSKSKAPDEVLGFLRQFRAKDSSTPLVVVPTTYGSTHEDTLYDAGANVIIYANHLMRAKIRAIGEYVDSGAILIDHICPANISHALTARNFGYLLQMLQKLRAGAPEGRLQPNLIAFLSDAEHLSYRAMEDTTRRLLDRKEACAANNSILPVKDLLAINAVHLSDIGRPQNHSSGNRLMTLMSPLRTRFNMLLRAITA
ncbi:hypothetical protein JX266_011842 [Neoarthrinium moseri]|nr:hypothetical protein JX266_011842 [Neoarthrinium moseri]